MIDLSKYYGITITNGYSDANLEAKLKKVSMRQQNILARIVINKLDDYTPYIETFKMVSRYATPMLQICDSYLDPLLTDDEYNARELWMLENLSEYAPVVEIANEIGPTNNWSGTNQIARARKSADLWLGHERVVTAFWPGRDFSVLDFNMWISNQLIPAEHRLISFYPNNLEDFAYLSINAPMLNAPTGLSECGMENWAGTYSPKMKELVKRRAYTIGSPVCWWGWQDEASY